MEKNIFGAGKPCTICHEPIQSFFQSCCKQYYHIPCLYKWVEKTTHCPICRKKYPYHYKPVLRQCIDIPLNDKIKWELMILPRERFCGTCNKAVYSQLYCGKYHQYYCLECIVDEKYCPECDFELPNYTIYKIWQAKLSNNTFHPNFLNHLPYIDNRPKVYAKRKIKK